MNNNDNSINLSQHEYMNLMAYKISNNVVKETRINVDRLKDDVNKKFEKLDNKIDNRFAWGIGLILASILIQTVVSLTLHFAN